MLWKHKKIYQETSEDVTIDPPVICVFLNNIRGIYTGAEGDSDSVEVRYILCGDETNTEVVDSIFVGMTPTELYDELVVEECIKQGSLFVGGINITNQSATNVFPYSIVADFGECP
jgi:hypothetical protein